MVDNFDDKLWNISNHSYMKVVYLIHENVSSNKFIQISNYVAIQNIVTQFRIIFKIEKKIIKTIKFLSEYYNANSNIFLTVR